MTTGRNLIDNLGVRQAGTPGTWAANADTYGNWIQFGGIARRAMFILSNGELDANLLAEVFEATDSAGAGAQELSDVTTGKTFTNGTDEGRVGVIEITSDDLSEGFDYIAVRPTPGNTDSFSAVCLLADLYEAPAANTTAEGVAYATP